MVAEFYSWLMGKKYIKYHICCSIYLGENLKFACGSVCPLSLLAARPVPAPATSCAEGKNRRKREREKDKRVERKSAK